MACRMLIGTGKLPLASLLDNFTLMAQNNNERHEHWGDPDYLQRDGWGVVTGKAERYEYYKNPVPCWKDPKFLDLYRLDLDFIMLHARKASPGTAVEYEFTHPFQEGGWYFCYNGTVYKLGTQERGDAQQLFSLILQELAQCQNITRAITKTVKSLTDYSALNFMMANGECIYVLNMYGKRGEETPDYFTLRYLQADGYTVVASERLPGCGKEWKKMSNGTLLILTIPDRKIEICRV